MSHWQCQFETAHEEVTRAYLACGRPFPKGREEYLREHYYKSRRYRPYDIGLKKLGKVLRDGFSFSHLDSTRQAKIWHFILKKTAYLGVGGLAISWAKKAQRKKSGRPKGGYWPLLRPWVGTIENWAHGDILAGLYCRLLSESPEAVYPVLKQWGKAPSLWKNRMAVVSLLYYYNPKRAVLPFCDITAVTEGHLSTPHYFVQKAVGWNLRELSRAYPAETKDFLKKNLFRLSPIAFTTAIEKLPRGFKESLKEARRKRRKL